MRPLAPPTPRAKATMVAVLVGLGAAAVLIAVLAVRSGPTEQVAPPKDEAVATTTTPLRTPTSEDPLRVLVAGDSLMGFMGPAIDEWYGEMPVSVIDDWHGSSGLVRPDFFDWPARLTQEMATSDPEVVIFGLGANDTQNITTETGVLMRGTPEWKREYQRRVAEVFDAIAAPGRSVYWVNLPMTQRDNITQLTPTLDRALAAEMADRPWVHLVDARTVLAPSGTFTEFLPDATGEPVRTLAPDGVHPTIDGARLIVESFQTDLIAERHLED